MAVITWRVLQERLEAGRGSGHHDNYLPWIWIRRKNSSPSSNQVADSMPGYRRASHFLAITEWHVALLCIYLGAIDVREQFPLWPDDHAHPLEDYSVLTGQRWPRCRGLLRVAEELGIEHGIEVGTSDVPYVATLDLAVTLRLVAGYRLAGISLKPHELIETAEPNDRIIERLALEAQAIKEYGATYRIADRRILGPNTGGTLEVLSSGARLPQHLANESLKCEFIERFMEIATIISLGDGITLLAREMKLDQKDANLLWRHLAWTRELEIDVTRRIEWTRPYLPSGRDIADALAIELFGEVPRESRDEDQDD